jgi:hypothetical protein
MAILIDDRKLSRRQNKFIREMLSPISANIAIDQQMQIDTMRIYVKGSSATDYNSLFNTRNKNIKANYFEIWKRCTSNQWALQKLYFRIEMKEGVDIYSEVLSFHIDLDNNENTYKKYPHIHIKHPKIECISNAHIPLNLNDLPDITDSIDKFNDNLIKIFAAINTEFISTFKF